MKYSKEQLDKVMETLNPEQQVEVLKLLLDAEEEKPKDKVKKSAKKTKAKLGKTLTGIKNKLPKVKVTVEK